MPDTKIKAPRQTATQARAVARRRTKQINEAERQRDRSRAVRKFKEMLTPQMNLIEGGKCVWIAAVLDAPPALSREERMFEERYRTEANRLRALRAQHVLSSELIREAIVQRHQAERARALSTEGRARSLQDAIDGVVSLHSFYARPGFAFARSPEWTREEAEHGAALRQLAHMMPAPVVFPMTTRQGRDRMRDEAIALVKEIAGLAPGMADAEVAQAYRSAIAHIECVPRQVRFRFSQMDAENIALVRIEEALEKVRHASSGSLDLAQWQNEEARSMAAQCAAAACLLSISFDVEDQLTSDERVHSERIAACDRKTDIADFYATATTVSGLDALRAEFLATVKRVAADVAHWRANEAV